MKKKLLYFLSALFLILSAFGAACGEKTFEIVLEYDNTAGEAAVSAPASGTTYAEGESVTLTVSPKENHTVSSVTLNGKPIALTDGKYIFQIVENVRIAVVFAEISVPESYTVTVNCNEADGSVTLSPQKERYAQGEEVTATVTATPGKRVSSFTVNGEEKELSSGKYVFRIEKNTEIAAKFEAVPMPQNVFDSLKGKISFTGEGTETRRYIGSEGGQDYEDYEISYQYSYETAYDGEIVLIYRYDENTKLALENRTIVNRDGKSFAAVRNLQGGVDFTDLETDFANYRNPFEELVSVADFVSAGGNTFLIRDAEKASLAARAFTGKTEEIASFKVFTENNAVIAVDIETAEQIGTGITLEYRYTAHYAFEVKERGVDLSARVTPYELTEEHVPLERALQSAAAAKSYTVDVSEDEEYTVFVTEDAVYNNESGYELGYIVKDGVVYEFYLEDGKPVIGDPFQFEDYDEEGNPNYHTIPDITPLRADFAAFSAAMFEPKGNGVYELRSADIILVRSIAEALYDGNDTLTMLYAESCRITVENDTLKTVTIDTKMFAFTTTFTFTYRDWDRTVLPVQFEGETPTPETGVPVKFYGTFRGQYHDYASGAVSEYVVVLSEAGIAVTIDGTPVPAAFVGYDPSYDEISLTLGGKNYTIANYSDGDTVDEINLSSEFGSGSFITVTLTRDGAGGEQPTPPAKKGMEQFYGTYEGGDYVISISEGGISVTVKGAEATVTEVSYDEQAEEISLKINGENFSISANSDDDPLSEIVLWKGWEMNLLVRVG